MAQSSSRLHFVCRSCRQAISRPFSQTRTFSTSVSRSNIIPSFQPTSSQELDALLLDWRRRVFTPAALSTTHRALVQKKSRRSILENDPGVTVTMSDGEEVKLEPLHAWDRPNKSDTLVQLANILSNTTDSEAWSQLPGFLEGMVLAKEAVPIAWLERMTRKANEQGQAVVIRQCAAAVKRTGLTLSLKPVTRELFLGFHMRFMETRLAGEDYTEEYKFAGSLALMLEKQDHCGGPLKESKDSSDMRRDLTVLGVLLELSAAKALDEHGGRDVEGKTGNLGQKLVALTGFEFVEQQQKVMKGKALEDWITLATAIRLALKVNGLKVGKGRNAEAELKAALKDRLNLLDRAIKEESAKVKATARDKPTRGSQMLEKAQQMW